MASPSADGWLALKVRGLRLFGGRPRFPLPFLGLRLSAGEGSLGRGALAFQFVYSSQGGGVPPKPFFLFSPAFFCFWFPPHPPPKKKDRKNFKVGEKNTDTTVLAVTHTRGFFTHGSLGWQRVPPTSRVLFRGLPRKTTLRHNYGMVDYHHCLVEYHETIQVVCGALCSLGFGALHPYVFAKGKREAEGLPRSPLYGGDGVPPPIPPLPVFSRVNEVGKTERNVHFKLGIYLAGVSVRLPYSRFVRIGHHPTPITLPSSPC